MIYDDFHIFNGWLLLHDPDTEEQRVAVLIDDIQAIEFREGVQGSRDARGRPQYVDVISYRMRGDNYAHDIEFPHEARCSSDHGGGREDGRMAWGLFDTIIHHGEEVK